MASDLQRVVDGLGDRLGRSVAIDDRRIRVLAYNKHHGEVDEVRVRAIMQREVPQELIDHLAAVGGYEATDLFAQPLRPELGLTIERFVMPIRYDGALLGFLWLMGSDGPVSEDDKAEVRRAAQRAAQILHRDHLLDQLREGRVREYLRDLLSGDDRLHEQASHLLIEEDLLLSGPVSALVVTVPNEAGQPFAEKDRQALAIGLDLACRRMQPGRAVHLVRADHAVVLVTHTDPERRELDDLTDAVVKRVSSAGHWAPDECYVGVGEQRPAVRQAHASYFEARRAADVARVVRALGTIVRYSRLGVHGLLAEIPPERLRSSIPAGLQRLLDYESEKARLTSTLAAYFKNAGDIRRTADDLAVHRASVHYRLRRIEEIAEVDLTDGDDRLALHLGLKVLQLIDLDEV